MGNQNCVCYCNKMCFYTYGNGFDTQSDITRNNERYICNEEVNQYNYFHLEENLANTITKIPLPNQFETNFKNYFEKKDSPRDQFNSTAAKSFKNGDELGIFDITEEKGNEILIFDSLNETTTNNNQTDPFTDYQITSTEPISQSQEFICQSFTNSNSEQQMINNSDFKKGYNHYYIQSVITDNEKAEHQVENLDNKNSYFEGDLKITRKNSPDYSEQNFVSEKEYEVQQNNQQKQQEDVLYYDNGNIEFHGTILDNIKTGYGISYYSDGSKKYEGIWIDDNYSEGKLFNSDETLVMEGIFNDGCFIGIKYSNNGKKNYEGSMSLFDEIWIRHGKGKSYFENGNFEFDGFWDTDEKHGYGVLYHFDGKIKYVGEFKDDKYFGHGAKYDICGLLCSRGEWYNDELDDIEMDSEYKNLGYSKKKVDGNDIYVGQLINEKRNGFGITFSKISGIIQEEGHYTDDKLHGFVKGYYPENLKAIWTLGYFVEGNANSRFSFYYDNGKLQERTVWENDEESNNRFGIYFNQKGEIDLSRSYKGEF